MKNNLTMLREGLESFDNDPQKSLFFYNNPQARIKLIQEIIEYSVHHFQSTNDPTAIRIEATHITDWLSGNYHGYEWSAHETHFHTSFASFASCPFTCLNEITTMLEKVIREKFAA
jgi:hypothetical protein